MLPYFQPETFTGMAQLIVTFFTVVAMLVNFVLAGRA